MLYCNQYQYHIKQSLLSSMESSAISNVEFTLYFEVSVPWSTNEIKYKYSFINILAWFQEWPSRNVIFRSSKDISSIFLVFSDVKSVDKRFNSIKYIIKEKISTPFWSQCLRYHSLPPPPRSSQSLKLTIHSPQIDPCSDLPVHHGQVPLLQRQQTRLAEQRQTQPQLEWLLY